MEVAQSFLGLPPPQKWPAAVGWERACRGEGSEESSSGPRQTHVKSNWKSNTKGLGVWQPAGPPGRAPQTGPPKEAASWGGEAILPNASKTKPS